MRGRKDNPSRIFLDKQKFAESKSGSATPKLNELPACINSSQHTWTLWQDTEYTMSFQFRRCTVCKVKQNLYLG